MVDLDVHPNSKSNLLVKAAHDRQEPLPPFCVQQAADGWLGISSNKVVSRPLIQICKNNSKRTTYRFDCILSKFGWTKFSLYVSPLVPRVWIEWNWLHKHLKTDNTFL